jgi:phosphocarrier protein HPr
LDTLLENLKMEMKEIKAMNCFNVTFKNPEEILSFLNTVEKYDITMDMKRGRLVVDAKSLLGLMNLGLNNVAELRVYGDANQLRQEISRYIAA